MSAVNETERGSTIMRNISHKAEMYTWFEKNQTKYKNLNRMLNATESACSGIVNIHSSKVVHVGVLKWVQLCN